MVIGSESRLAINVPILEEIVELRRDIAKMLGYPTWADYVTETKVCDTICSKTYCDKYFPDGEKCGSCFQGNKMLRQVQTSYSKIIQYSS